MTDEEFDPIAELESEELRQADQRIWDEDLLSVMKTREGRAVLHRLAFGSEFGRRNFPTFSENALRMAYAAGRNAVGNSIWSEVKRIAPDLMRVAEDEYDAGLRARKG